MGHAGNALGTQKQMVLHSTQIDTKSSLEYRKQAKIPGTQDSVAYKGKKALDLFALHTSHSDPPAIEGRMKGKKKLPIFLRFIPPPLVPPLERVARKAKRSTRSFCVSRLPFWALSCCGLLCCFCTGLARCSDKYRSQHVKARQCFRVFIASVVWIAGTL
jgi:hypothetical protein